MDNASARRPRYFRNRLPNRRSARAAARPAAALGRPYERRVSLCPHCLARRGYPGGGSVNPHLFSWAFAEWGPGDTAGCLQRRANLRYSGAHAGPALFRVSRHASGFYTTGWGGVLLRSDSWEGPFEQGPDRKPYADKGGLGDGFRHGETFITGDTLHLLYHRMGDRPERIPHATVEIDGD